MNLHEEYIKRHNLNVPIIQYDKSSKIYLRHENLPKWRTINFEWMFDYGHPCPWRIVIIEPIHDSYGIHDRYWKTTFGPKEVYWDEYDDFVRELVRNHREWKVVTNKKDLEMFNWETFLYMADKMISEERDFVKDKLFLKNLSLSIDFSNSLNKRTEASVDAIQRIREVAPLIIDFYDHSFTNRLFDSKWFSKLIKNESLTSKS